MSAGVFVGVLGWVLAGLLAAFLAVLTVGTFAAGRRTGRACRVQNVCVFLARLLLVFCAIVGAALFAGVGLWFLWL